MYQESRILHSKFHVTGKSKVQVLLSIASFFSSQLASLLLLQSCFPSVLTSGTGSNQNYYCELLDVLEESEQMVVLHTVYVGVELDDPCGSSPTQNIL